MFCASCGAAEAVGEACGACGGPPRLAGGAASYALLEVVGHGAMGTTWRASRDDGAVVAVKEVPLRHVADRKARELLDREVRVLRTLAHTGVPAFHEAFTAGEGRLRALYLVQEFIDGPTLQAERLGRRPDAAAVVEICIELLGILDHLHTRSPAIVHRDIKPANVMRRPDGRLVLVDFGAVRDAIRDSLLGGSTVAGTFGYMAPEQFRGEALPATDLYGVGALAVALLTGEEPRDLLGAPGVLRWRARARCGGAVAAVIDRLLALEPGDRPADAAFAARLLRAAVEADAADRGPLPDPRPAEVAPPPVIFAEPPPRFEADAPFEAPMPRAAADLRAMPGPRTLVRLLTAAMVLATVAVGGIAGAVFLQARSGEAGVTAPVVDRDVQLGPLEQEYHDIVWRASSTQDCLQAHPDVPAGAQPEDPVEVRIVLTPGAPAEWAVDAGPWAGSPLHHCLVDAVTAMELDRGGDLVDRPTALRLPFFPAQPDLRHPPRDDVGRPDRPN